MAFCILAIQSDSHIQLVALLFYLTFTLSVTVPVHESARIYASYTVPELYSMNATNVKSAVSERRRSDVNMIQLMTLPSSPRNVERKYIRQSSQFCLRHGNCDASQAYETQTLSENKDEPAERVLCVSASDRLLDGYPRHWSARDLHGKGPPLR